MSASVRECTVLLAPGRHPRVVHRVHVAVVDRDGVHIAGCPECGVGVASGVEDGAWRAATPGLLAVLSTVNLIGVDALEAFRSPPEVNTVGPHRPAFGPTLTLLQV